MIVRQELAVHLFAPLEGPRAGEAVGQLRTIWGSCRERFGLDQDVPGQPRHDQLPGDLLLDLDNETLSALQGSDGQMVLRRLDDVLNLSVALTRPGTKWPELASGWGTVGASGALLGEHLVFLGSWEGPSGATVNDLVESQMPVRADRAAGWADRPTPAGGLSLWETGLRGTGRPRREFVAVAPPGQDRPLSALAWSDGAPALPPLARYLLHSSRLQYQADLLRGWVHGGRGRSRELDEELHSAPDRSRPPAELLADLRARARRLRGHEDDVARIRADLQTMKYAAQGLQENLVVARSLIGLGKVETGTVFDDDRRLGEWLSGQLADELKYLDISRRRIAEVRRSDATEMVELERTAPAPVPAQRTGPALSAGWTLVVYAHENPEHKDRVGQFVRFLRDNGVDARRDSNFEDGRQHWGYWSEKALREAAFVIVVCSPGVRVAAEWGSPPDQYRGIRHELNILNDLQHGDYLTWGRKILPVVLWPDSVDDVPRFLLPVNMDHYRVDSLTFEGAAGLLHVLHGRPPDPLTPLGPEPDWPDRPSGGAARSLPRGERPSRPAGPPGDRDGRPSDDRLADDLAVAVRDQWKHEQKRREVDGTATAPVRWRWAPGRIALPPEDVAEDLPVTGDVRHLGTDLYERLGPGACLVLVGEPGTGKTTTLVQMLLSVLDRRDTLLFSARTAVAVPIWLSLGTWDTERESLERWVARMLARDHPAVVGRRRVTARALSTPLMLGLARVAYRGGTNLVLDGAD